MQKTAKNFRKLQLKDKSYWSDISQPTVTLVVSCFIFTMLMFSATASAATCNSNGLSATDYSLVNYASGNASQDLAVKGGTTATDDDFVLNLKTSITSGTLQTYASSSLSAFTFDQTISTTTNNNIEFGFSKPLTNLAISVYDIDGNGGGYRDKVVFSGVTVSGQIIKPTSLISYPGSTFDITTEDTAIARSNTANSDYNNTSRVTASFSQPVTKVIIEYGNAETRSSSSRRQLVDIRIDSYCTVQKDLDITKTDNRNTVGTQNTTIYDLKVLNSGVEILSNTILKDPAVAGLVKQSNIICDTSVSQNVCSTPPTIAQLEAGFKVPTLNLGQSYAIKVPAYVTAETGSVTNTATATDGTLSKTAVDTDIVNGSFDNGVTISPKVCPAGHKTYYIGNSANAPTGTNVSVLPLTWTNGATSKDFTFNEPSGNKVFTLNFSDIKNVTPYAGNLGPVSSPFFGSVTSATSNAINMQHSSEAGVNHKLSATINKPVSQFGFVVQDNDAYTSSRGVAYIERVDVSSSNGKFDFNKSYHTSNLDNSIVTARENVNCGLGECPINAYWSYNLANTSFSLTHSNTVNQTPDTHLIGYSDFYFCLAPPKLIVKKVLDGSRVLADEEFKIDVTNSANSTLIKSFTTIGDDSGFEIGKDNTGVISLTENTTYTIKESVVSGSMGNYDANYQCVNKTTGSTSIVPSGKGNTFTLSNLYFGDEIICTITNTPKVHTISGIVFNDNGGITTPNKDDTSPTYTNNSNYFNRKYDSSVEKGIPFTTGHTVTLAKCAGDTTGSAFTAQTVNIKADGTYSLTVPAGQLGTNTKLCLTQNEPAGYTYTVDTTANVREVAFTANQLAYPNNNFGDVVQDNAALVLVKRQYFNDCNISSLGSIALAPTPREGYSITKPTKNVEAGQCIAYRIDAINRGNVPLTNVVIEDTLQKAGVKGASVTSTLTTPKPASYTSDGIDFADNSVAIGNNGTVITKPFNLAITSPDDEKVIFFNTKYGNIQK